MKRSWKARKQPFISLLCVLPSSSMASRQLSTPICINTTSPRFFSTLALNLFHSPLLPWSNANFPEMIIQAKERRHRYSNLVELCTHANGNFVPRMRRIFQLKSRVCVCWHFTAGKQRFDGNGFLHVCATEHVKFDDEERAFAFR